MTHYVYALRHPKTGEIRYVGLTSSPTRRFEQHVGSRRRKRSYVRNWVLYLRARGLVPQMDILFGPVERDRARLLEIATIAEFRKAGLKLCNQTGGGEA